MMNRREFLTSASAAVPVTVAGRVWAAPKADMRLLVVFLRGAYDATNVLIPVSSDFYYEARPTLVVPRPGRGSGDAALFLTADWGLHPALKDSLWPFWERKQIAFFPFAGTDDLTRSHFETQNSIELGQPRASGAVMTFTDQSRRKWQPPIAGPFPRKASNCRRGGLDGSCATNTISGSWTWAVGTLTSARAARPDIWRTGWANSAMHSRAMRRRSAGKPGPTH